MNATFTEDTGTTYHITANSGVGGRIVPGDVDVPAGAKQTFFALADYGYSLDAQASFALTDCPGSMDSTEMFFTTEAMTANCQVTAVFVRNFITVNASQGLNGTLSPKGVLMVGEGSIQHFKVTPSEGYALDLANSSTDCGGTLEATIEGTVYSTAPITIACSVHAAFKAAHTVTVSAGEGGTITPQPTVMVLDGETQVFTLEAADSYSIGPVTGTCGGVLNGTVFTTNAIDSDCSVIANFIPNVFTLTLNKTGTCKEFGTITNDQQVTYNFSGDQVVTTASGIVTLTANAAQGAEFVSWSGCDIDTDNECLVAMTGDRAVGIEFECEADDAAPEVEAFPWPMFMPALTGMGNK